VGVHSDCSGEFGERVRDAPMGASINPEFVVAAPEVLHEGVTAHDHSRGVIAFEAAHRTEPRFEATVVGFDPVIRVLGGVVERGGYELVDHGP
jgi:hypothetical protein